MATMERAAELIRGILDRRGVPDAGALLARGYGVSERDLYVHAVSRVLRNRPRSSWNENEIAVRGMVFCAAMPDDYRTPSLVSYALPGGMWLVANEWGSGLNLAKKPDHWTSDTIRPSRRTDGVVTDSCEAIPGDDVRRWARELAQAASAMARQIMGDMVDEDCVEATLPRWNRWQYETTMRNGTRWICEIDEGALRHDDEQRLLHRFRHRMRAEVEAAGEHLGLGGRAETLRQNMQEACAAAGVPGVVRVVPGVRSPHEREPRFRVLLDGYGPTGLASTVVAIDAGEKQIQAEMGRNFKPMPEAMAEQMKRHRTFGPTPGSHGIEALTIDGPTARKAREDALAVSALRRYAQGRPADAGDAGIGLRLKERRILGTWEMAPSVTWKGDRLEVKDAALNDTVAAALVGQSVRRIVDHPHLSESDVIRKIEQKSGKLGRTLIAHVDASTVPVNELAAVG